MKRKTAPTTVLAVSHKGEHKRVKGGISLNYFEEAPNAIPGLIGFAIFTPFALFFWSAVAVAAMGALSTLSLPPDEAATPATRDSFPALMALVNSLSSIDCFFNCGLFTGLSNLPAGD